MKNRLNIRSRFPAATLLVVALLLFSGKLGSQPDPAKPAKKKKIQLGILLDTSSSMDGLIDQAKSQLWNIVNEFSKVSTDSIDLSLEIAVYEYGNNGIPAAQQFVRQVTPFTTDLDKVSEALFALSTNGGSEYCGAVIQESVEELAWSSSKEDLHVLVIAGNEPFNQGTIDYKTSCLHATEKDILINTIYCGSSDEGFTTGWKSGSTLGNGFYASIDQNSKTQYIETPYDKEIVALNDQLNATYIPYGSYGAVAYSNQSAQDGNAAVFGSSNVSSRVVSKANAFYSNASWDLVDAYKTKSIDIRKVDTSQLPAQYTKMSADKLEAEVKTQSEKREAIKKQINDLNKKRLDYIEVEKKKLNIVNPLETVIIHGIRLQATNKGFRFKD